MKKIYFAFGLHNHQPVGNFEHIFQWACKNAYKPFLEILKKHPSIKMTLHYSGILFSWISKNCPEVMENITTMVERGQVEIMTGGFYEPILPFLPDRDKIGQIKKLTEFIKNKTGYFSEGMWLTERIWDQHLVSPLNRAGIKYTAVDDTHFNMAGLSDADLNGYYVTEHDGETLKLFAISKQLRYLIPFAMPDKVLEHFKNMASEEEPILVMADDGEKFGLWPGTFKHVYQDGWLENFFDILEKNQDWLITTTFSEYIKNHKPKGRIYLPLASYEEMMKWSLFPSAQIELENIEEKLNHFADAEQWKRFIKGGVWWNFFAKYPESNNMHKKMLYVSDKVDKAKKIARKLKDKNAKVDFDEMDDELWQGQCNCAYWHGVFGGLYLAHLRSAIYERLIKAEKLTDLVFQPQKGFWNEIEIIDFDKDGNEELLIRNPVFNLYFNLENGGTLFELDYKPRNLNVINTLKRTKEAYHNKFLDEIKKGKKEDVFQPKSIHESITAKEDGLENFLSYDWYPRVSLLDHFLQDNTTLENFKKCHYGEQGDFINQSYNYKYNKTKKGIDLYLERKGNVWVNDLKVIIHLKKTIKTLKDKIIIDYEIINLGGECHSLWFGPEFNFSFSNPSDEECHYYGNNAFLKNNLFSCSGEIENLSKIGMKDKYQGIDINLEFSSPCLLWYFPIETVSLSESGLERVYQSSVVFPNWKVELDKNQSFDIQIIKTIKSIK